MSNTAENGQMVSVHYVGTLVDGTEFDNSHDRGAPITFELGAGKVIPGFDAAITGMTVGETKRVEIPSGEAYGDPVPEAVQVVPRTAFPDGLDVTVGMHVQGSSPEGNTFPALVTAIAANGVTIDMNHPLAGKDLVFEIELVDIAEDSEE
jgi:peptidylprolyl isomerase